MPPTTSQIINAKPKLVTAGVDPLKWQHNPSELGICFINQDCTQDEMIDSRKKLLVAKPLNA
jgi:hypothetical protein